MFRMDNAKFNHNLVTLQPCNPVTLQPQEPSNIYTRAYGNRATMLAS